MKIIDRILKFGIYLYIAMFSSKGIKFKRRYKMINLNKLAVKIAKKEAGKKQVSIAQIKEILKITFEELACEKSSDILKVIERYE